MPSCFIDAGHRDIFSVLIDQILQDHADTLPDFGRIQVLLPDLSQARRFRKLLLEKSGHAALIPPRINTLRGWVEELTPPAGKILNTHARELMLVETLQEFPAFGKLHNPWTLADTLLRLFDELQLSHHQAETLSSLFEAADGAPEMLSHFSEEALKIQLLWRDFQQQLEKENTTDRISRYRQGLERLTSDITCVNTPLYLAGYHWLHAKELRLVTELIHANKITILLQPGQPLTAQLQALDIPCTKLAAPHTLRTKCLDTIFTTKNTALKTRAEELAADMPESVLQDHLQLFPAESNEQEAQAVALQTRQWLIEGKQRIAIVTEDRKLARRISALLDNAGLSVQDAAGWPLSTTMAAGVLERWLETVENEFYFAPLLDVLKSGFLRQSAFPVEAVYRLEKDIIERENIARRLDSYAAAITDRSQRLHFAGDEYTGGLEAIITFLREASAPLLPFLEKGMHAPLQILSALTTSLQRLGLYEGFEQDPAGQRILQELKDLEHSLDGRKMAMRWSEFRTWVQRALETHNFRPAIDPGQVDLIDFDQSNTGQYDALIIAGADYRHLPGHASGNGLFNDTVRQELGLKHWRIQRQERFSQFRRLLQTADNILITWTQSHNGETELPSPWVDLLDSFQRTAWGASLEASGLRTLLDHPEAQLQAPSQAPLPAITKQPAPPLPTPLIPKSISVSAHQMLIDCPYRFFAARGLKLKPRETIAEQLSKRDYGNLVHRCLQTFHQQHPSVSAPGKEQATAALVAISEKIFAEIPQTDYAQHMWWQTWKSLIPEYIDWQIERETDWRIKRTEAGVEKRLEKSGIKLTGRIDRIDCNAGGVSLIDYKTGGTHRKADIETGEDVQLTSYALLTEEVQELVYLQFDVRKGVKAEARITAETLEVLTPQLEQRLDETLQAIQQGEKLPAHGDKDTCKYCEFSGLCRRQSWS